MASKDHDNTVGASIASEALESHKELPASLPTADTAHAQPSGLQDQPSDKHDGRELPKSQESAPANMAEEDLKTPKSEDPSSVPISSMRTPSTAMYDASGSIPEERNISGTPKGGSADYSARDSLRPSDHKPSVETISSSSQSDQTREVSADPEGQPFPASAASEKRSTSWRDLSTQTVIGPGHDPETSRPTSVPNFQSTSLLQRRAGQGYPEYPDQSFAALHHQQYPPPYQPKPLRTSSSRASQISNFSPNDTKPPKEHPHLPSGAKTTSNTPAQSPSLFSPIFSPKKPMADSDDGHHGTPLLHPAHLQEPKETHKMLKDVDPISGRKMVNNYEFVRKLGSGQHGTVKLGRNLDTGEYVAVKIVRRFSKKLRLGKAGDPNDMIKKEVAVLKKARHPHVVSLLEVIDDDEFEKVYLVLEFVERGEIIWRKATDRPVALFERERLERETTNGFDEESERFAIQKFNEGVEARRIEKARRHEDQRKQASERLANERPGSYHSGPHPFWSLEYGEETEHDFAVEQLHDRHAKPEDTRLSRADIHAAEHHGKSPQSATPVYTPRSAPHANMSEPLSVSQPPSQPASQPSSLPASQPTSQPVSRPTSPSLLDSVRFGSLKGNKSGSELAFQATLERIMAEQDEEWTQDEEDFRYVPCLTLSQALEAFRDTVLGLEYLHFQGIIHRDIKPANLLWTTDYRVKISDFGVSYLGKPLREDFHNDEMPEADAAIKEEAIELAKTVGTPAFYAPELCDIRWLDDNKRADRPMITGQIDVWALGVTLYGMVFGRLPFFHPNEFRMYEKIAQDDVFIPRLRLKGVEHTDRTPSNHNKRLDDVLEYEEVDDTLRDLLKRLLAKHPSQRISLNEVKHHPWVIGDIENKDSWLDETDPSVQSQGKRIEVSSDEVADAVVALTIVDRIKTGVQRIGSVLRGRGSRKRTDSNAKVPESVGSTSAPRSKEERRTSLRGDERIFSALQASRETSEHPLAQSVTASPEIKDVRSYFVDDGECIRPHSATDILPASRPQIPDRALSTADSMKTVRAPVDMTAIGNSAASNTSTPTQDFSSTTTTVVDPTSSSSSLGGIFGGAGRRLVNTMRSRERDRGHESPSQSSRSSSVDRGEDCHASPSLAFSSAVAAGHVDQPPALREEVEEYRIDHSPAAFEKAKEQNNRRQQLEYARTIGHRPSVSRAADLPCPPSPDDEAFFQHRPTSAADSAFAISSSSEQIVSGESTAHSRIPSVVSGASSISVVDGEMQPLSTLEKIISPFSIGPSASPNRPRSQLVDELNPTPALAKAAAEEEAGYNGEGEQDSDSEDEGLAMA